MLRLRHGVLLFCLGIKVDHYLILSRRAIFFSPLRFELEMQIFEFSQTEWALTRRNSFTNAINPRRRLESVLEGRERFARAIRVALTRLMGSSEYEFGVYLNSGALFPFFISLTSRL